LCPRAGLASGARAAARPRHRPAPPRPAYPLSVSRVPKTKTGALSGYGSPKQAEVCVEAHAICHGRIAHLHARRQRLSAELAAAAAAPGSGAPAPEGAAPPRARSRRAPRVGGGSDGDTDGEAGGGEGGEADGNADRHADGDADADDLVSEIEATVVEERQESTAFALAMCTALTPRQLARVRRNAAAVAATAGAIHATAHTCAAGAAPRLTRRALGL
jgi:hypothetical protein